MNSPLLVVVKMTNITSINVTNESTINAENICPVVIYQPGE